jgi:hypothetical protein
LLKNETAAKQNLIEPVLGLEQYLMLGFLLAVKCRKMSLASCSDKIPGNKSSDFIETQFIIFRCLS